MRRTLLGITVGALIVFCGCKPATPAVGYEPIGTVRDVMTSIVDPSADFVWNSVSDIVTAKGEEQKMPRTDEEWKEVHNRSVALVEAANLLLVPNRPVAKPGEKADNPDVEHDPADIYAMMTKDRATFLDRIGGFRQAALKMLAAADARDVAGITAAGEGLDKACEECHMTYWYSK